MDDIQPIAISEPAITIEKTVSNISIYKLKQFLNEHYKNSITEDVINNQSFVDGMRSFLDIYNAFNNTKKEYLLLKTRQTKKTELQESLEAISKQILEIES